VGNQKQARGWAILLNTSTQTKMQNFYSSLLKPLEKAVANKLD
jgi:hypothetical protein